MEQQIQRFKGERILDVLRRIIWHRQREKKKSIRVEGQRGIGAADHGETYWP